MRPAQLTHTRTHLMDVSRTCVATQQIPPKSRSTQIERASRAQPAILFLQPQQKEMRPESSKFVRALKVASTKCISQFTTLLYVCNHNNSPRKKEKSENDAFSVLSTSHLTCRTDRVTSRDKNELAAADTNPQFMEYYCADAASMTTVTPEIAP